MSAKLPGLVFLGTPEFAVPSLEKLAGEGAPIRMVVTQPDRPKGRGKKLTEPPVKVLAQKLGLPVFQPERMREEEALARVRSAGAEVAVVVAYGQIFPQAFLDLFPLGALNVHGSLLPRYRGAAPIQRSILSGDSVTGISIMLLDAGMDTGAVLSRQEEPILAKDTFGTLYDRLARMGADLLIRTLADWKEGRVKPVPQDDSLATDAPPIAKDELRLSWTLPARRIVDTVRAFDPAPGAYGFLKGKRIKFYKASLLHWEGEGSPGEVIGCTDSGMVILGGDGKALALGELQLEGQRRMPAAQFLRGHPMAPGSRLE